MRAALVAWLVLVGVCGAQTVYFPTGGLTSYAGPSVPNPHTLQAYRLFLPDTPPPPGGYPVLVDLGLLGFNRSEVHSSITPSLGVLHDALDAGIAVVSASCTIVRGPGTTNPVTYPGNGVFLPPAAGIPPGYSGSIAPYLDPSRPMPQKDVIMLVQHLKWNAASLGIDPTRLVARGVSASALIWTWCLVGPDRADLWANPQGQETEDTHLRGGLLIDCATWWPVLAQTQPPAQFVAWHFPKAQPGGYDQLAIGLNETDPAWLVDASPLGFGLAPGAATQTQALPLYMQYDTPTVGTDYLAPPYDAGTEADPHTVWSGFAWKALVPGSRLVLLDPAIANGQQDVVLPASQPEAVACDKLDWLREVFDLPVADPWTPVGVGLAGTWGVPALEGCGPLTDGSPFSLTLTGGPPLGPVYVVAGLGLLEVPFLGGTLVPTFDAVIPFPLNASGGLVVGTSVAPGLSSGGAVYWQAWMPDGGAPHGYSATNGLCSTVP